MQEEAPLSARIPLNLELSLKKCDYCPTDGQRRWIESFRRTCYEIDSLANDIFERRTDGCRMNESGASKLSSTKTASFGRHIHGHLGIGQGFAEHGFGVAPRFCHSREMLMIDHDHERLQGLAISKLVDRGTQCNSIGHETYSAASQATQRPGSSNIASRRS